MRFTLDAAGGTRVELEHRNFERMGGTEGEAMRNAVDNGWPGPLSLYVADVVAGP